MYNVLPPAYAAVNKIKKQNVEEKASGIKIDVLLESIRCCSRRTETFDSILT